MQVITELIADLVFFFLIATVVTGLDHMALIMAVFFNPPIGIAAAIRDTICVIFAIGIVMGQHFALAPHEFPINPYIRKVTGMHIGSWLKTK